MNKRVMSNGVEEEDYDGRPFLRIADMGNGSVVATPDPENDLIRVDEHSAVRPGREAEVTWLRFADGRMVDDAGNCWWIISDEEYDEDGDFVIGTVIGVAP